MKAVQINATCGSGSTGKICVEVSKLLCSSGVENYILYCSGTSDYPYGIKCADEKYIRTQALKARLFGNWGFNSKASTEKMIKELEKINPDTVHLHNIHGHDCDLDMLFRYFKEKRIKLFWTFHDCWAFTGYCTHFMLSGCDKWKNGCGNCPQKKKVSWFADRSAELYRRKKELFSDLDLTVITPSVWLSDLVKQSFLKDCPIKVIHNGINLNIFKPTESDFRERHGLADKKTVLGVSFGWKNSKGLDVFIELSKSLGDEYRIVLVGTDEETEKLLPPNIIPIRRTKDQKELAQIYTASDVFVNPTREDNYPTVNMEAIACGTPVITFRTGGSPETVDPTCGCVVESNDIDGLKLQIKKACEENIYTEQACLNKRKEFDSEKCFLEYIRLYGVEK